MSFNSHNSYSSNSDVAVDKKEILHFITTLYCSNPVVQKQLTKAIKYLIKSRNWKDDVIRLEHAGLKAGYMNCSVRDVINNTGEIVLLRNFAGSFRLLHFAENRWQFIKADGSVASAQADIYSEEKIEAVVLRIPADIESSGSFSSIAALWPELKSAWAEVGVATVFINSGQLLVPLFSMLVYDKIAQNGLFETLWALTLGMVLYLVTDTGMRLVRSWATERIGIKLASRGDESLWSKLMAQMDLPSGGFPRFISNYRDLTQSREFVSSSYLLSLADIPFLMLYLLVVGIIAWQLMIVALLLVILYGVAGLLLQNSQNNLSKEAERNNTRKLAFMGETLGSLDVVRTTPGAGAFLKRWRHLAEMSIDADAKKRLATLRMGILSSSTYTVTTVVMLIAGVYLIHEQLLSTGQLIACNLLASRAMALVASTFAVFGKWQDFKRAAARMENSLETVVSRDFTPRPEISGNISVIGVGKHYEGRPAALESVSFTITPGERIAMLGRPGAGKSTLLQCLGGLCRPDTGQILIDGLSLEDISRADRVNWLAYKGQNPEVFAGTLEDNLRISGCTDQTRFDEVVWASGLESEIKSGRMTLGMNLEARGSNLSGGQRQKVALARTFAQPSRIMLLDEPTLGLDPESERLLAERLPKLLDSRSILIMSTHSAIMLETVQRIIALDAGRIVADGLREKLVSIT